MQGLVSHALVEAPFGLALSEADTNGSSVWEGWGSVVFVTALAVMIAGLIGLAIWQGFKTYHVRAAVSRDQAYQKLAEQATAAQEQFVQEQTRLAEDLSELKTRVGNIERILREVE